MACLDLVRAPEILNPASANCQPRPVITYSRTKDNSVRKTGPNTRAEITMSEHSEQETSFLARRLRQIAEEEGRRPRTELEAAQQRYSGDPRLRSITNGAPDPFENHFGAGADVVVVRRKAVTSEAHQEYLRTGRIV